LAFGVWTLLMVFFFYRRRDKDIEAVGKMGSAIAAALAVLKYGVVAAVFTRLLGSGATMASIGGLVAVCVAAIILLLWLPRGWTDSPTVATPGDRPADREFWERRGHTLCKNVCREATRREKKTEPC
jgi:hypothetical protein